MSDELMIQPGVNPQIQPQRISAMPYALGGAVVGGAGAYGVTSLLNKEGANSYEELIQKANEQDKVELTSKKKAVEEAEAKLSEAGKAVYDGKEKEALDKAIEARDKELAKLTEGKKITIKKGGEILPYDPNWSMTEKQINDYKALYSKYETAKNNLEGSTEYKKLDSAITSRRTAIDDMYGDIIKDASSEIKPKSTRRKDIKSLDEYLSSKQGKSAIEDAVTKHKIARLTDNEIIKLGGGEKALVDSKGTAMPGEKYIPVTTKDGSVKYAKVKISKMGFGRTEYQKLMEERTDEVAERVSKSFKSYTESLKQLEKLPESMKIDKGLLRNLKIQRSSVNKDFLDDLKANVKSYESELKTIDGAKLVKDPATGAWKYDSTVQKVLDSLNVDTPADAKKVLDAKLGIGRKYVAEEKALLKNVDDIVGKDATLSKLEAQMAKLKRSDKNLNNVTSQIKGQFKKFIGNETATTVAKGLSEEEAMKKDSYKDLAKVVEEKQAAYDKVASEKGKVNEGAKKAAEENLNKAKEEYNKIFNEVKGKFGGMSGKAKAAWAAGAAVVGAGIGALIVNNKNKKIEAEAQQDLYA